MPWLIRFAGFRTALVQRGLAMLFLGVAALMAQGSWLRPPLSPDLSALHIPLGIGAKPGSSARVLNDPRGVSLDSIGALLLALISGGMVYAMWRPARLAAVAGLLLASAAACNAALLCNHPALVEALDREYSERQQMAAMLDLSPEPNPSTRSNNGRIGLCAAFLGDEQPGDLARGLSYLVLGPWLVLWAALGVLLGSRGTISRRLGHVGLWGLAGIALSALVGGRRSIAEYHWLEATRLEMTCDDAGSRAALERSICAFPELEFLERTWLFQGKLDHRLGRNTAQERFFRAYQLSRDRLQLRTVAFQQDLPSLTPAVVDYRLGQETLPAGFNRNLATGTAEIGAADSRSGPRIPHGVRARQYAGASADDARLARHIMDDLVVQTSDACAVRHQAARIWVNLGVEHYARARVVTESGLSFFPQEQRLECARAAWERAAQLGPGRHDCALYLGSLHARLDPRAAIGTGAHLALLLPRLGDQVLRADVLSTLGDANFLAGLPDEGRRRYAESFSTFDLPTIINYRAQKGLGGL